MSELLKAVDVLLEKTGLSKGLVKENNEYIGPCPFCGKDGFRFHVSMETYSCCSCKRKGAILTFLVQYKHVDVKNTLGAWNWLADMMFDEKSKGRPVDMTGWILED